jgi:hypothetical protein
MIEGIKIEHHSLDEESRIQSVSNALSEFKSPSSNDHFT